MFFYVNGDSHSAGADIIENYCFAEDDPKYTAWGRRPHPEAVPHTYGYKLASQLNAGLELDAESASSNDRILRTTKVFLNKQWGADREVFIIIGWSTWEREEWDNPEGNDPLQVTAGGQDIVPAQLQEKYKQWVLDQTEKELNRKTALWHERIYELHCELKDKKYKHIFFNCYNHFDEISVPIAKRYDWGNHYIEPYDVDSTYCNYLNNIGIKTSRWGSTHFGSDGHQEWANFLLPKILKQKQVKQNFLLTKQKIVVK